MWTCQQCGKSDGITIYASGVVSCVGSQHADGSVEVTDSNIEHVEWKEAAMIECECGNKWSDMDGTVHAHFTQTNGGSDDD